MRILVFQFSFLSQFSMLNSIREKFLNYEKLYLIITQSSCLCSSRTFRLLSKKKINFTCTINTAFNVQEERCKSFSFYLIFFTMNLIKLHIKSYVGFFLITEKDNDIKAHCCVFNQQEEENSFRGDRFECFTKTD